jgi:hypothetical protein
MNIIADRMRLTVAVKGGVAEFHLQRALERDPDVSSVEQIDEDGRPDLDVEMRTGRRLLVECKNGRLGPYKGGAGRVEVQKTRSSKGNPASRLYFPEQFDVVAVCLWPETGPPQFRFKLAERLEPDTRFPDRIAPIQRIDGSWAERLADALNR